MTKGKLLKFLEPFTDDIEILVASGNIHYKIKKLSYEFKPPKTGVVLIQPNILREKE